MHVPGALIVTEAVQGFRGTMHCSINRDRHVVLVTRVDILISIRAGVVLGSVLSLVITSTEIVARVQVIVEATNEVLTLL